MSAYCERTVCNSTNTQFYFTKIFCVILFQSVELYYIKFDSHPVFNLIILLLYLLIFWNAKKVCFKLLVPP